MNINLVYVNATYPAHSNVAPTRARSFDDRRMISKQNDSFTHFEREIRESQPSNYHSFALVQYLN